MERLARQKEALRNPFAWGIAVIQNYVNDPQWEETTYERNQRGRTDYEPG